jgi:hypothetical protein
MEIEGMDRFGRAIDEKDEYEWDGRGLIHKEDE